MDAVEVLLTRRDAAGWASEEDDLLAPLPGPERRRVAGLRRPEDRRDSAIGWRLLTRLAAARGVELGRRRDGRPVAGGTVDVSLSHSGGWIAAAAVARGRVGIDVEVTRPVPAALVCRCLSDAERAELGGAAAALSVAGFLTWWTAKEAYLKATGTGLATDPRTVELTAHPTDPTSPDTRLRLLGPAADAWAIECRTPAPGVWLALCRSRP